MKPLILGMNAPKNAKIFDPTIQGGSGARMLAMINSHLYNLGSDSRTPEEFVRAFDWMNCISGPTWDFRRALDLAPEILEYLSSREKVIILGRAPTKALSIPMRGWGIWRIHDLGFEYCCFPHPSGLTRSYNSPLMREVLVDTLLRTGDWS